MENIKNTEAINNEMVKEDATMAEEIMGTEAIETTAEQTAEQTAEPKLPKFNDVLIPADEERKMLLITAVRNKNTKMFWDIITVLPGADVKTAIAEVTDAKRINLVDERNVRKFIEEGKVLRGMASTVADFTAKYAKVMDVEVEDKAKLILDCFTEIIKQVDAGVTTGVWCRPEVLEAEKAAEEEKEAPAEEPAAEEVEDPFEVEDAE